MSRLIGLTEAAERTGISKTTLRRRVKDKKIPAFRAYSECGKILFHPKILDMYIEQQLMANTGGFEDIVETDDTYIEPVSPILKTQLASLFDEENDYYE